MFDAVSGKGTWKGALRDLRKLGRGPVETRIEYFRRIDVALQLRFSLGFFFYFFFLNLHR